jgi:hypothetical protein
MDSLYCVLLLLADYLVSMYDHEHDFNHVWFFNVMSYFFYSRDLAPFGTKQQNCYMVSISQIVSYHTGTMQ